MAKFFSVVTACSLLVLFFPLSAALAAGGSEGGGEEAAAESTFLTPVLAVMSVVTLAVFIYYMFKDNG